MEVTICERHMKPSLKNVFKIMATCKVIKLCIGYNVTVCIVYLLYMLYMCLGKSLLVQHCQQKAKHSLANEPIRMVICVCRRLKTNASPNQNSNLTHVKEQHNLMVVQTVRTAVNNRFNNW